MVRNDSPMVDCAGRLVVQRHFIVLIRLSKLHAILCERLFEVHEDEVKVLLVLQVFLTEYSKIENLLNCAPSCSETCLFFFDDLLSLWLQSRRILSMTLL